MKGFFTNFFNGNKCCHEWETIDKYTVHSYEEVDENGNLNRMPLQNRIIYVQQCRQCGELKHYTVNLGS